MYLVARTVLGQSLLQVGELVQLLAVQLDDDIVFLQDAGSRTAFYDLSHKDTFLHAQLFHAFLHLLHHFVVHLQVGRKVTTLDAQQSTLNGTILLQVGNDLRHQVGRDGKAIARIGTRRRIKHGVDTYQLAGGIHQGTTTVTRVDGGIGLNERLDAGSLSVGSSRTNGTSLGADDTGCNRRIQIERVTYGQYPFTHFQRIRVAHGNGGEIIALNL